MASQSTSSQRPVEPCRYKTGKTLGAGSYSVVKECVHIDTARYYAAKVINKRLMAGREHMVRNEIAVLRRVSVGHQNILTLVDYFETQNNLYLVTDLALGGELFDRICRKGSYFESDAADLVRAVLSAVAYLHDHDIVHRDLKPENLLFRTPEDNADLLIADFGLSRIMDEEQFHVLTTTCGTPGYMAPEIFKKSGHGKPVDIWAIGVITYFLLCGYTPFDRDSNLEEMQAILAADYSFTPLEYWRGVSQEARNFINRCLATDPQVRMTAHQALQHPWVNPPHDTTQTRTNEDLLPTVRKNFNARRVLHRAIDTVRAINKLREGGGFMMDGALSIDPKPERVNGDEVVEEEHHAPPAPAEAAAQENNPPPAAAAPARPIQMDSRGNARGQTEEQIREQERKVKEMVTGLWSRGRHAK
ncbi:Calcium/calmodulin-dependent protein kinase cmkB [Penicillium alfredii]|uniref:Calcium/calmodulin-dependent protein kinase cmkB n=1 Tax=Penicillium alfredii TaxID=1506179 RepID=A0A9W9K7R1_9EURO|nr:Calcium/calmodulin-dependent protein kinase cmkB [Penicillium alfredii]KAJ5095596.1 Calcium/calmodulin-dependent protein kinase cmkB [Penicillium alfredii]